MHQNSVKLILYVPEEITCKFIKWLTKTSLRFFGPNFGAKWTIDRIVASLTTGFVSDSPITTAGKMSISTTLYGKMLIKDGSCSSNLTRVDRLLLRNMATRRGTTLDSNSDWSSNFPNLTSGSNTSIPAPPYWWHVSKCGKILYLAISSGKLSTRSVRLPRNFCFSYFIYRINGVNNVLFNSKYFIRR